MSKSFRNRHDKNGVNLKITGESNKKDKQIANRKFRRKESKESRDTLLQEEDMFVTSDIKDVSNNYNFSSDGNPIYFNLNKEGRWIGNVPDNEKYRYRNK